MSLDLQAISISSAFTSILNFFKSQENNSRWKDLTTGAEGIFLIRMLANIITNISYRLITARRENYLSTANLLSSVLGMAVNYGYSASRGRNQRRRIQFTPNGNYTLPKLTVIGSYDSDHDIILLNDSVLKNQQTMNLEVTVGKINSFSFTAGTNEVKLFSQYTEGISEDYRLFVDNVEVPTSNQVQDLIHNKYLVRTNPYASVDIMYNNNASNATYSYGTESIIRMDYVQLDGSYVGNFTEDMFQYGTLGDVLTISDFIDFESIDSIKRNAPLQHCTEGIVRSKVDYTSRAQEIVPNIKQVEYKALTPSYTLITYLKDDYTLLSTAERESLMDRFKNGERLMGTLLPDTTPPRRELITLNIFLELYDKFKETSEIQTDINNLIVTNYEVLLKQKFNVYTLERLLESLSYVFRARVSFNIKARTNSTLYNLGDLIQDNGTVYKASKILGLAGQNEPTWNVPQETPIEVDTELETEDGAVIWRCYKKLDVEMTKWTSRGRYGIGDYVYTDSYPYFMFKCVDVKKYSATTPPNVSVVNVGDFIIDGSIVWVCKATNSTLPERENSTLYKLGDSVNIGGVTFECVSYVGYSASSKPSMETDSYEVDSATESSITLKGDCTPFFSVGDRIKAVTDIYTYVYSVSGISYDATDDLTILNIAQTVNTEKEYSVVMPLFRGTKDGEIFWTILSSTSDITEIQYDWNVYNSFKYSLTIGGR